jgi:putative membrane protein
MAYSRKGLVPLSLTWLLPGLVFAQERPYDWDWGMHPMRWMGGMWGLGMMFMMLIFWALVITAIVLGVRWLANQGKETRDDKALEILRQRYARGEIEKEEFEAKRKDLS